MRRVIESDVCIVGSGISAAKLADERRASVLVVEAGGRPVPFGERMKVRERFVAYGENPWAASSGARTSCSSRRRTAIPPGSRTAPATSGTG